VAGERGGLPVAAGHDEGQPALQSGDHGPGSTRTGTAACARAHGTAGYRAEVSQKSVYFVLMGLCLVLIILAWNLVRLYSITAAVVMSIVAALLPPIAVIIANRGRMGG
jgi:hypothetical protein